METVLSVRNLVVTFATDDGVLRAVDGVSFDVRRGESLGLVGESGCGKSVTALSLLRLIPSPPGRIERGHVRFRGRDLLSIPLEELRRIRGRSISMIFQDPMTALSPLQRVGQQLVETLRLHSRLTRGEAREQAVEWLRRVNLPDPAQRLESYPHELSGGMRQRVMIAMALMLDPDIVVADEPTTALDVTIQAQVFELMTAMRKRDTALVLITHNMGVIWEMCVGVTVMYAGEIVETGPVEAVFRDPLHPYTQALLLSIPSVSRKKGRLAAIPGQVPSAFAYPAGCRFRERCGQAMPRCAVEHPPLYGGGERTVRCFLRENLGPHVEVETGPHPAARSRGPEETAA